MNDPNKLTIQNPYDEPSPFVDGIKFGLGFCGVIVLGGLAGWGLEYLLPFLWRLYRVGSWEF